MSSYWYWHWEFLGYRDRIMMRQTEVPGMSKFQAEAEEKERRELMRLFGKQRLMMEAVARLLEEKGTVSSARLAAIVADLMQNGPGADVWLPRSDVLTACPVCGRDTGIDSFACGWCGEPMSGPYAPPGLLPKPAGEMGPPE